MTHIESILEFAANGNAICPIGVFNGKKKPLARWKTESTTDPTKITSWWTKYPTALVARPEVGNEITIDVDVKHGANGRDSLVALMDRAPALEAAFRSTQQVSTPSGGWHFKFMNPKGYEFSNDVGIWNGIDIRVAGKGLLVVPPSKGYEIENDGERAEIPEEFWLLYREAKNAKRVEPTITTHRDDQELEFFPEGQRNDRLFSYLCGLRAKGLNDSEIHAIAAIANHQKCKPALDTAEVEAIAASVLRYEIGTTTSQFKQRGNGFYYDGVQMLPPKHVRDRLSQTGSQEAASNERSGLIRPIHKAEVPLTWLVPGLFPVRQLSILAGDSDVGKSYALMAITSWLTNGTLDEHFPETIVNGRRKVYYFSREDDEDCTMLGRFRKHNADLDNITVLDRSISFGSFQELEHDLQIDQPAMVIFDTASMFLSNSVDMNDQKSTTQDLEQLVSLSRKYNFAVIVVCHLRKAQGSIKERILGSVGFVSLARSVVGITFKDDTRDIRIMANVKGNLSQHKTGLEFRIVDGVVNFNVTNIDYAAQMAGESTKADTVQKCRDWLASYLPQCPEMLPSSEFYRAALEQGFSKKLAGTLAKDGFQITSVQKSKMWYKANILSAAKEKMANDEVIVC